MPNRTVTVTVRAVDDYSRTLNDYSRKVGEADQATDNLGQKSERAQGGINRMGAAMGGFIAGIAADRILEVAGQLNELGANANAVETRFNALAGPMGDVQGIMADLREASLGVASDMEIQEGANLLMQMGLAEDPAELEEMIAMITRLKSPTEDLGSAISNFSLMLANQSVERLDSFGISSGRVRTRINELLESGVALDREQAFKMATMEEGARSIARLGDSAEIAGTALGRLATNAQNAKEDLGQFINSTLEGAAGSAEDLGGILQLAMGVHPAQVAKAEDDARRGAEAVVIAMQEGLLSAEDTAGLNDEFLADFITRAARIAAEDPNLGLEDVRNRAMDELIARNTQVAAANGIDTNWWWDDSSGLHEQLDLLTQISQEAMTLQSTAQQRATEEQRIADELAAQAAAEEERARHAELVSEAMNTRADMQRLENEALNEAFQHVEGISGGLAEMAELPMPEFMRPEQADNLGAMADEAQAIYEDMLAMSETDAGLFTDTQLENARLTAENMQTMADEADRAAQAFENMSLTDLFGQSGGGMLGEIQKLVLEQAAAGGMDEAALAELGRSFALSSGEETAGSLALSEQFAPIIAGIAQEQGPDIATAMTEELGKILSEAALAGIDVNSEEFLSKVASDLGAGTLMADFDAEAYVTAMTDANTAATETVSSMDSIAEDMPVIAEEASNAASGAADLSENLGTANTEAGALETTLTRLSSVVHTVKVVLDVDSSALQGLLSQITRDNGGVPPGSDPRLSAGQAG